MNLEGSNQWTQGCISHIKLMNREDRPGVSPLVSKHAWGDNFVGSNPFTANMIKVSETATGQQY